MISRNILLYIVLTILAIYMLANINSDFFVKKEEKKMFPSILGDTILKSNDTGINSIASIVSYDDFKGDIINGYMANYTGSNGTMIIFIARMQNNESAYRSLKDMTIRMGYNESLYNLSIDNSADNNTNKSVIDDNATIVRLPIKNPELFLVQKDKNKMWHYAFSKEDKVYWVGFNNLDIQYHMDMMIEVYKNVDNRDN